MTMLTVFRATLIAALCSLALLAAPARLLAEPAQGADGAGGAAAGSTQAVPADRPGEAAAGCPYSVNGSCCGTCQDKAQQQAPDPHAGGGCPCQRAKRAREGL
jgi:hypothetical protein